MKEVIQTSGAPQAIGAYSQAVRVGDWLFLSGQIAMDPSSGEVAGNDAATQTRRVLDNLAAVLQAAGGSLADVVKTTVYVVDMIDFPVVNTVYAEYFSEPYPARAAVQVARLPKNVRVEIDAIASLSKE